MDRSSGQLEALRNGEGVNTGSVSLGGTSISTTTMDGNKCPLEPRTYQLEMLEASMQRNIIVAMDTGSGKTQIAIMRIQSALEDCAPSKLVWFLAPTVALAAQQHDSIARQLPAFQTRFLSGSCGVEHWSSQSVWDAALEGIRIVVSTPQVLLDALVHGFVNLRRIALLVFDEAHNCLGDHPYSRIMQDFYHPLQSTTADVPHVLGLTASPIINNRGGGLDHIEQTLNATSKTPRIHREDLLRYVHRPVLTALRYKENHNSAIHSYNLQRLQLVFKNLDINSDPWIIRLRKLKNSDNDARLRKALLSHKTTCQDQMKRFVGMALNTDMELGTWAAEYFIWECISRYRSKHAASQLVFADMEDEEKDYILKAFVEVDPHVPDNSFNQDDSRLSPKVHCLIDTIGKEMHASLSCLVFVKTRAAVAILAALLSIHHLTRSVVSLGTYCGTSNSDKRKSYVSELLDTKDQTTALDDLRTGKKNMLVSTSVLEEGIDVSACNCVISFDKPPNLKTFIQRRGRARQSMSRCIVLFGDTEGESSISKWQDLEEDMQQVYMDDMRQLQDISRAEIVEEAHREFIVHRTGAKLTLHDAVQHLSHFCALLPATRWAVRTPSFLIKENDVKQGFEARVILPNSVDASVREAHSRQVWTTEKFAKRDAAFEAYIALYHTGLVNDNLLPLLGLDDEVAQAYGSAEKRENIVEISGQLNPWSAIAQDWHNPSRCRESIVTVQAGNGKIFEMSMIAPYSFSSSGRFDLYWDAKEAYTVTIDSGKVVEYSATDLDLSRQMTEAILSSIYKHRMTLDKNDFPLLFVPISYGNNRQEWLENNLGRSSSDVVLSYQTDRLGLVRDLQNQGTPHIFLGVEAQLPEHLRVDSTPVGDDPTHESFYLKVSRLSKRADFLHQIGTDLSQSKSGAAYKYLPASKCEVDNLCWSYSKFALFIPSIMHSLEVAMVAEHLQKTLLSQVQISNSKLVLTAISSSVAREASNYQTLELLGDAVLKFITSVTMSAQHLTWHEGYLSLKKGYLVSNAHLASAAQRTGLGKYILTKTFTGLKWRPLYNSALCAAPATKSRNLSTKTLADVVEALLGAAYADGGFPKALVCLAVFVSEVSWPPLSQSVQALNHAVELNTQFPSHFPHLESLVCHVFASKPLLVEALTHPSYIGLVPAPSYQRLEFLGDAVLDFIVTTDMYEYGHLPHHTMHLLRTALVNANFLGFLCMDLSMNISRSEVVEDKATREFHAIHGSTSVAVWHFMRSSSPEIATAQDHCVARFNTMRTAIRAALDHGACYPWVELTTLGPEKFFSDIIESIIGAIYVDTHGSLDACRSFLQTLGVMPYLRKALVESIHLLHPKEELGQLAVSEKVTYETCIGKTAEGQDVAALRVLVGKREICTVEGGKSKIEVETRAAGEAVRILKEQEKVEAKVDLEDFRCGLCGIEAFEDDENDSDENHDEMMVIDG